jgi:hypothetical protein
MSEIDRLNLKRQCVGRFCFNVPDSMERRAERYSIKWTDVSEEAYPTTDEDRFQQLWNQHLSAIEKLKEQRVLPRDVQGKILEWRDLEPNRIRLIRFHRNAPHLITVAALGDANTHAIWVSADGSLELVDKVEAFTKEIVYSYRAGSAPQAGKNLFFLSKGAFDIPFSENEEAKAFFGQYPSLKFEVEITTTDKEQPGLFERFTKSLVNFGIGLVSPVSLRNQRSRTAGGLKGQEMILKDGESDELSYIWVHPGKAKSAEEPEVRLSMDAKPNQQKEAELVWNTILDSMRPAWK